MKTYFSKFRGGPAALIPVPSRQVLVSTFIGAFVGIGALALLHYLLLTDNNFSSLIGSFGATAVLLYACPESPLAQPWNTLMGHFLSAIVGITISVIHGQCCEEASTMWLAATLAVSISITVMQITRCVHPPGGATALLAVTSPKPAYWAGYLWVLLPAMSGALILLLVALFVNNAFPARLYPQHWSTPWSKNVVLPTVPVITSMKRAPSNVEETVVYPGPTVEEDRLLVEEEPAQREPTSDPISPLPPISPASVQLLPVRPAGAL